MKNIFCYSMLLFILVAPFATSFGQRVLAPQLEQWMQGNAVPTGIGLRYLEIGKPIGSDVVTDKIQTAFQKAFSQAKEAEWFILDKKYKWYGVRFKNTYGYNIVVYTKRGYALFSIVSIAAEDMPVDDRRTLTRNYEDFTINQIIEISLGRQKKQVVRINQGNHLLLLCMENGYLDVLQDHRDRLQNKKPALVRRTTTNKYVYQYKK